MDTELATLKAAIQRVRGQEVAGIFSSEALKLLWDEFYRSEAALKIADRQTLLDKGLPGGLVDALLGPAVAVSPTMAAFAASIKSGVPIPESSYKLPDNVFFLGKQPFGNALIRDSYVELYKTLKSTDDNGRLTLQQVIVSGMSGVGTSMFLVYYLLRHLHEGDAVLWHAPANQSARYYYFTPSHSGARVQRVTEEVAEQLLESEQGVYYAVDSVEPSMPVAFRWSQAVVIAKAPDRHKGLHTHLPDFEDFGRFLCAQPNNTAQILLPLWQDDEVLDLREVAYPDMTEHQVLDRLARCRIYCCMHGIPRAIFDDRFDQFA